jgi:hypothetical protein
VKQLTVYDVDVDVATIDAAVRSDPEWSPDLVDKRAGGVPYYFWTADGAQDLSRATASRPLGVGGTLAVADGLVLRAVSEREIVAALTVADGATLADRVDVGAVLDGLEPYAPYEVWLTNEMRLTSVPQPESIPAPLRPSILMASARAMIDGHRATIVALVHRTTDDADENARRLQRNLTDGSLDGQPWSERFESWTVATDGPLVLAVIDEGEHRPAGLPELDQLWRSEPP